MAPKPASSQVRVARCNGLVSTFAKTDPASRSPRRTALRSPRSVSGRSVRPVCWPLIVHAVSPWRARYSAGSGWLMTWPSPIGVGVLLGCLAVLLQDARGLAFFGQRFHGFQPHVKLPVVAE